MGTALIHDQIETAGQPKIEADEFVEAITTQLIFVTPEPVVVSTLRN